MIIDTALKEWASICTLLADGHLAILFRKGGIHEDQGPGVFQLEHEHFVLFPAWLHQDEDRIKPNWRHRLAHAAAPHTPRDEPAAPPRSEPDRITLHAWAQAVHIQPAPSRQSLDALDDLHPWDHAHLDMRWNYKPDRPLWVVVLSVHRLDHPRTIDNLPDYQGCRSWVALRPDDALEQDPDAATDAIPRENLMGVIARVREALA